MLINAWLKTVKLQSILSMAEFRTCAETSVDNIEVYNIIHGKRNFQHHFGFNRFWKQDE